MTASAETALGLASGTASQVFRLDWCYRTSSNSSATLTNFAGFNWTDHLASRERRAYSAVGSAVPGAGTWTVGVCVRNTGAATLADNDWLNGWVLVTN